MGDNTIKTEDYTSLKEFRVDIDVEKGGEQNEAERKFSVCFWIYLVKSSGAVTYPAPIINQLQVSWDVGCVAPFLLLDERKIMILRPLFLVRKDRPPHSDSVSLFEAPHASMVNAFPLEKWVHVGCEVSANGMHLHINGESIAELCFPLLPITQPISDGLKTTTLVGPNGYDCLQGYVHDVQVSHLSSSVRDCYFKDPPLQLSIDQSSTIEIEEDNDSVWSIVGGKASCRRIFSLDVVLLNAVNQSINKELEVISSLLYADNGLPVEKTSDDEAPLLASFDGIEFPSCDRPSKLLNGRTSFKLKISQLSSKCENRLFRIKFELLKYKGYHFLEAFSHSIRCISRSRNPRTSSAILKRPTSAQYSLTGCPSIASDNGSPELHSSPHEENVTPSSKRFKLVQEQTSSVDQLEERHAQALAANQAEAREPVQAGNSSSDTESTEERISDYDMESKTRYSIPDPMIFKYCLGSLTDRALLMKDVSTSALDEELLKFADKVSLYSGCAHHRHSIIIGKKLIEEGTRVWNSMTQQNNPTQWENVVFEIEKQFMKIASCSTRSLEEQDYNLLRRIAGCREYMAQENFEKMWCWLYPVACTVSRGWVNSLWKCTSPKWIEGFITKEEAELSLRGTRGLQEPGTFILRFPTSRSWPHPDAGSLVVTYVGSDYLIHHRMLSFDYIDSNERQRSAKQVQEMLLAEPELCRLGRIMRS
ncbi:SH2 domain-containing protein A [Linum perenne]